MDKEVEDTCVDLVAKVGYLSGGTAVGYWPPLYGNW